MCQGADRDKVHAGLAVCAHGVKGDAAARFDFDMRHDGADELHGVGCGFGGEVVKHYAVDAGIEGLPPVATFGTGTLRAAATAGLSVKASAPTPEAPSMARAVEIYLDRIQNGESVPDVEFQDQDNEEFMRNQQSRMARKSRRRPSSSDHKH